MAAMLRNPTDYTPVSQDAGAQMSDALRPFASQPPRTTVGSSVSHIPGRADSLRLSAQARPHDRSGRAAARGQRRRGAVTQSLPTESRL